MTNDDKVTLSFPPSFKVSGARGLVRELDMTKATPEKVMALIDYAFGVITQRASASVDGYDEKVKAEQAKADEVATWKWQPGAKGAVGGRIDLEEKAAREVFADLFRGLGIKKAEAEKRAKASERMADYFRLAIAQQTGEIPDAEALDMVIEANKVQVESAIADRIKALKEEEARIKGLHGQIDLSALQK